MCKVYNTIGCLTAIKAHLREHNINEYHSINELINFQKDYIFTRQQIILNHQHFIAQEKSTLSTEVARLDDRIIEKKISIEQELRLNRENLEHQLAKLPNSRPNIFQAFISYIKKIWLRLQVQFSEVFFNFKISHSIKSLVNEYNEKNTRYQFIVSNPNDAVMQSCSLELQEHIRKKNVIDQMNNLIYGALGEQKVANELEKLDNNYILINDFTCSFHPAIFRQKKNDYIKSIQIDHILIAPSGIFLIETKNWSQQSVNNPSLYSPVQQIKRANFALYRILFGKASNIQLALRKHHWGDRKIPIRNLILLINHKPIEEFQYVKILTLDNLLSYINYFKPCFSIEETNLIANHLLRISI